MAMKVAGIVMVKTMLERDSEMAQIVSYAAFDDKIDELIEEAKNNAPVDKYNLENAIQRVPERPLNHAATRGAGGKFQSVHPHGYVVEINIKDEMTGKDGKTVRMHPYADIMEESDRAGQGSPENNLKRARGGEPGRKYMERAYDKVGPTILPQLRKKISEVL